MEKQIAVEENPVEVEGVIQTGGQDSLDEGFAQIVDEMINWVEELDTEELEKQADDLNCINEDCIHFDKSLLYGCGCSNVDDTPFDVMDCINRIPANVSSVESNIAAHVCNIELGPVFTRFLPTPVADEVLADYAREMARQHTLWVKTKIDAKAFAKACKEVTDRCEDEEIRLAEIVGSGTEESEVPVRWSFDYAENIKRLVRQDTMEVVEEAPMTAEDRQGDLFGRVQESIENVQNCLGEGAKLDAGDDSTLEQDTEVLPDDENALETISDASGEIGANDGVSFPTQEELDQGWPDPPERVA